MEHYLLLISAIGSCIAALTGLLILRSRYGLPRIQAHVLPRIQVGTREDDPDRSKDTDQEVHRREVCFKQPDDPSVWLVCDVSISRNRYKWLGCGSFRTGGSGAVERKMDLSYYGSSEGILGLGSWVGQNNLTRKTERLDCWDLLT